MKKRLLSLALALALCLGLTVPVMAAEPYTYEDESIAITNVVKVEKKEGDIAFTCVVPVTFSARGLSANDKSRLYVMTYENPDEVTIDNFQTAGNITGQIETDTVKEPGTYMIEVMVDSEDQGHCFWNYLLIVQDGGADPTPAPKPNITDPSTTTPHFSDVPADAYYADAVMWAIEENITAGTSATTFSPNATCTEAQILTFLWRAKGSPAPGKPVSSTQYYAQAAAWAVEQGIVDEFEADIPCTRAMAVSYLWKLAGSPAASGSAFTDVPAGADYAQAVAWAVKNGVTSGTSQTTFSPDTTCTRGQIVTFLYRDLKK
ncbi:S-layer homology domain-containing protein [uncultured Dysosmobacter sp.]|uniref:S-layer homology domain-containing protein n=1 Tax=uncultured Dysosmobacter sp. TaxID=2591384 RepID=UPI0026160F62|nr:S-layer homology domain-containing protein [uncultured Dysosmobacter sp.]